MKDKCTPAKTRDHVNEAGECNAVTLIDPSEWCCSRKVWTLRLWLHELISDYGVVV